MAELSGRGSAATAGDVAALPQVKQGRGGNRWSAVVVHGGRCLLESSKHRVLLQSRKQARRRAVTAAGPSSARTCAPLATSRRVATRGAKPALRLAQARQAGGFPDCLCPRPETAELVLAEAQSLPSPVGLVTLRPR